MPQRPLQGLDREEKMAAIPEDVELVSRPVYLALVDLSCSEARLPFGLPLQSTPLSALSIPAGWNASLSPPHVLPLPLTPPPELRRR